MGGLASLSHVRTAFFPSITLSSGLMDTRSLLGASVRRSEIRIHVASYLPFSALSLQVQPLTQHLELPGLRRALSYGVVDQAVVISSIFWRDGVKAQISSFLQKYSIFLPEEEDISWVAT